MNTFVRIAIFAGMVAMGAFLLLTAATPLMGTTPSTDNSALSENADSGSESGKVAGANKSTPEKTAIPNPPEPDGYNSGQHSPPVIVENSSSFVSTATPVDEEGNGERETNGDGKEVKDPKDGKTFIEPDGKEIKEVLEPIGEGPLDGPVTQTIGQPNVWQAPSTYMGAIRGGGTAVLPPGLPPEVEPPDLPDSNDDVISFR